MSQKCKGCKYYRAFCGQTKACHYAIDMLDLGNYGELRGSSAEDCTHKQAVNTSLLVSNFQKNAKRKNLSLT